MKCYYTSALQRMVGVVFPVDFEMEFESTIGTIESSKRLIDDGVAEGIGMEKEINLRIGDMSVTMKKYGRQNGECA
jgi:hypothetical protein